MERAVRFLILFAMPAIAPSWADAEARLQPNVVFVRYLNTIEQKTPLSVPPTHIEGDATVKQQVIARYLSADTQSTGVRLRRSPFHRQTTNFVTPDP